MKWMIASDIHGSSFYTQKMLEAYRSEKAERLLLLGDILYHGPRNDLTQEYNPLFVSEQLNNIKDQIVCVRGNCDAEVDQMMLKFPIMADYVLLAEGSTTIFATHGHLYNQEVLPSLYKGDILLTGHTHIPACIRHENYTYMNPGSVSLPKNESWHGYMLLENGKFVWKDLEGNVKLTFSLADELSK